MHFVQGASLPLDSLPRHPTQHGLLASLCRKKFDSLKYTLNKLEVSQACTDKLACLCCPSRLPCMPPLTEHRAPFCWLGRLC